MALLRVAREVAAMGLPILGLNLKLGFPREIEVEAWNHLHRSDFILVNMMLQRHPGSEAVK